MQFSNLGAKGVVSRPIGDVDPKKKGVANQNSNDECRNFSCAVLHGHVKEN
jgi:hypothetical protein